MKIWIKSSLQNAAWAPLSVFVFYAVAANGFNAYILYPWLDFPTHFCGGMAITYFFLIAVAHSQRLVDSFPRLIQLILSLGLTAICAVIWEFLEFTSDAVWNTRMNLGVSDTLSDLFFGLLGGTKVGRIKIQKKSPRNVGIHRRLELATVRKQRSPRVRSRR